MSVRKVLRAGHPTLRKLSNDVAEEEINTKEFKKLLRDMFDTMNHENGIGLAAPQIGVLKKIVVVGQKSDRYEEENDLRPHVLINPQITALDSPPKEFWEGCLSLPGMRGLVIRPSKIHMQWQDEKWNSHSETIEGFRAVVYQHECDHLFGTLYIDKLKDTRLFGYNDSIPEDNQTTD